MNRLARNTKVVFSAVALALLTMAACGSSRMKGTYSSQTGVVLDLRSGGEASFTGVAAEISMGKPPMGGAHACTYKVDGKTLHLTCEEHKFDFDIHDDGSLTGDPLFSVLRKSKS
jgi:hypothetical protein